MLFMMAVSLYASHTINIIYNIKGAVSTGITTKKYDE